MEKRREIHACMKNTINKKRLFEKGMSIIEIVIAIAVAGMILGIVIFAFRSFNQKQHAASATEEIVSFLRQAREQTLGAIDDDRYGVHFETARAVLFKGDTFIDGAPGNKVLGIDDRLELFDMNAPSGNVIFERLTGALPSASSVSLRLKDTGSASTTIIITGAGSIYVER